LVLAQTTAQIELTDNLMQVFRVIFFIVGTLTALLGAATIVMAVVLYSPGVFSAAAAGSLIYFGIAAACFYAVVRITRALSTRRRDSHGICVACGYDMRSTPDRCSECGAVPTQPHRLSKGG
jgi:uncharacterized membrane protein HdeD (DUF308 family)